MGDFDLDTALEGGEGRYRAELSADWDIWGPLKPRNRAVPLGESR